jgi:intracellular sulfur oxidation DsrE/DsrF family protein
MKARSTRWLSVLALASVLSFSASIGWAQKAKTHRIVFELTSDNQDQWQALLNNIENAQKAFGKENTEVEVVTHGKGLGLIKGSTPLKDRVIAISHSGARFVACENTMRKQQVKKEDLLPIAGTVDSGIAEVIRKQEAGWSYIKSGS